MSRMITSNVLFIGLDGLGVEIAKNVILAGVKSVALYDKTPASYNDLSSQFYLQEKDIGKPRDQSCVAKLAELNPYVPVNVVPDEISEELINQFKVVVATGVPVDMRLEVSRMCRNNNVCFIVAETRGLFGMAFCDFGDKFVVLDVNGENPHYGLIASIDDGTVYCIEDQKHGLEDGDFVTFKEIRGMEGLNNCPPVPVKVLGPHSFFIGDTSKYGEYLGGGIFEQMKQPKELSFKPYEQAVQDPEFLISDFAKFERPALLHICFLARDEYQRLYGVLPRPRNKEDSAKFLEVCRSIITKMKLEVTLDEEVVSEFSWQCRGQLGPMAAVLGGFVAQETLKACSGKFHPLFQFLYFDSLESLPANINDLPESNFQPSGNRYDGQIQVLGKKFQEVISSAKGFLVGAGAIGCEMLKNWALLGVASSTGRIYVTDMDSIEKSNLNRQFFFRSWDVSRLKSQTAAEAVTRINPDLEGHITAYADRVGAETEHLFNEQFFGSLDFVTNALDNVEARKYMDLRCVYFHKPLLESGTLGTKGNTQVLRELIQVVVPFMTESYSSTQDPPEKSVPYCTLRNFPNLIEHTVEWALDEFKGLFSQSPESANQYLTNPDFLDSLSSRGTSKKEIIESIYSSLCTDKPSSFKDCVTWARLKFEEYYSHNIQQLLFAFPPNFLTEKGIPFWSGPKRAPKPLKFDSNQVLTCIL